MSNQAASTSAAATESAAQIDLDEFRLRRFVALLEKAGELEIRNDPLDLIDIARNLDGNPKSVLFRQVGPEKTELVGNVLSGRRRLGLAFGMGERELLGEVMRRIRTPRAPVEVSTSVAPVHQVVLQGEQADLTKLPVHLHHTFDGGPYISAGMDVTQSLDRKRRNLGYRRLMLRGRREGAINLTAPSDLRAIFAPYVQQKEHMPMAFVIGSHPADSIAAVFSLPLDDEFEIAGALRSAPVPLVRCATIDAMVPADAEVVLEGYLDSRGWFEPEGPFGEFLGYYGAVKMNPVFHLTAITMRRDALFQTASIGGRFLAETDTSHLNTMKVETAAWSAVETAIKEPVAMCATPACGGVFNLRCSLRQRYPGEARNAMAAILASSADIKHVFMVDDDIDVFSDAQMEWALGTRFQADRDLMVMSGMRTIPFDPSLDGRRVGSKAGFDLTIPFGKKGDHEYVLPEPPVLGPSKGLTVRQALAAGPQTFRDLMEAVGTRDGRDVLAEMDAIRSEGRLERAPDGRWKLKG
jgi:UbiD family decarboxylase